MSKEFKRKSGFLPAFPAWFFIGSMVILIGIIITMTIKDLNRGREIEIQTLLEKSTVLIRSFESGTRTGMSLRWRHEQRQTLLEEMAYQPGILYLAVTDTSGKVLAHSDPERVGTQLYTQKEMDTLKVNSTEQWRIAPFVDEQNKTQNAFEVYRFFKPLKRGNGHRTHMMNMRRDRNPEGYSGNNTSVQDEEQNVIFTAFDTSALDAVREKDIRNTIIFLSILLLLALASLLALFWARRYQRSSQQLQDSKAFSTEIINNLPIGLITTNEQRQIRVVNQAAENMLGSRASQLFGQPIQQALPAEWNQLVESSHRQHPVVEREIDYPLANGQTIPLSISVAKIVNDDGHFLGNVFIFKDMREVRQLQEEVRRKEKLAAIGNLAAGVAHEIRNPLSSIKGFAKYFEGRSAQGSEEQELAKVMAKEVDRLNRVITELLGLVRPTDLRIQQVDVNALIEHSLHLIRQDAESKNIVIDFHADNDLPLAEIDPDRFTQALLNLYLNAIQAIGSNGTLTVSAKSAGDNDLHISVKDSGKGIKPDDLANIFNPYFTTKASGTGLGLTVVQKVIEEHQGKITVHSHPQSGTDFNMTIPLRYSTQHLFDRQTQEASDHDKA
ncbi:PAS domain-containing sensor histidine kinase [Pragia fontium]|uniref:Sensor histidine kinase ZraS n=1 Tax=Pragia fontium TaxID=82985 RepID=A0ABQ5LK20_9GAMM|nr:ATP-binding protein [Pragia fontium]GKX63341.1 PAS domain-containing sensor histidine kinase [Pragia fontium]